MRKFNSLLLALMFLFGIHVNAGAQFVPEAGKQYMIKNVTHGKYLDSNGQQAILSDNDASSLSQRFVFEAQTDSYAGSYKVKQVSSGNYLRRSGGANFNNDAQGQAQITAVDQWSDNFPISFEEAGTEGQYYMSSKYSGTSATITDRYFSYQTQKSWVRSWGTVDAADIWSIEEAPQTVAPTLLEEAIQEANDFLAGIDPSTDIPANEQATQEIGEYGYAEYNALLAALSGANAYLSGTSYYLSEDVVQYTTSVSNAFTAFKKSISVTIVSDMDSDPYQLESGAYYIKAGDYYLTAPEEIIASGTRKQVYLATKNEGNLKDNQVWSVQYNKDYTDPARYTFVSCIKGSTWVSDDESGLGNINEKGEFASGNTADAQGGGNEEWRNFSLYYNGSAYCLWILRSQNGGNAGQRSINITPNFNPGGEITGSTVSYSTTDKSYLYTFVPYVGSSVNVEEAVKKSTVSVKGGKNEIIITNATLHDKIEIHNISGVLVKNTSAANRTIAISKGIYIVKIAGANNIVSKVIVR